MFRDNLFKMGPKGCPKTLVRNYHYSLCNNPEECSSHLGFDVPYCKHDLTALKLIKLHHAQNNILSYIYPIFPNIKRELFSTSLSLSLARTCTHTHTHTQNLQCSVSGANAFASITCSIYTTAQLLQQLLTYLLHGAESFLRS